MLGSKWVTKATRLAARSSRSRFLGCSTASVLRQSQRHFAQRREPFHPRPGKIPMECSTSLEAVSGVHSGARVFVQGMLATPEPLLNALCDHARNNELTDIELVHLLTFGPAPQITGRYQKHFKDTSLFISENVRHAVNDGRADYVPIFLSEIPQLFLKHPQYDLDVALLHVSPPDKAGFCSLGIDVDIARSAAASAKCLIGLVNKHMPRTHGDGQVHVSQFDYITERHVPLPTYAPRFGLKEQAVHDKIGEWISNNLIDDGSTMQIGIGEIPHSVVRNLMQHKDLGIHTEMFTDGVIDLIEKGVATNAKKQEHCGKTVATFVMGTQRLYDFVHDNPSVLLLDTSYTNSVQVIASNPKVCAINAAIEIDLSGQVVSDSIGHTLYSGVGGQVDFIRGAAYSEGGKPIIAIPSMTRHGESKITPYLRKGSGVVTTRAHVQWVVTEYGAVNLFGKNLRQRAADLISISHPRFREWLDREAYRMFKGNWDPTLVPRND